MPRKVKAVPVEQTEIKVESEPVVEIPTDLVIPDPVFEETINTLKYANRAKNIKCKVVENKKLVEVHIAEYKNIIGDLRSEIDSLKG